ncbi:MAG: ABC transporter permease [Pseudomonadota bacterium]
MTITAEPLVDQEERSRARQRRIEAWGKWTMPVMVMALAIVGWHLLVTLNNIPHYILPGPGRVFSQLVADWSLMLAAAWVTLKITLFALFFAVAGGVGLAVLFTQSKWAEMSFFPYAVILQVTPVVAVAPLIQIYVESAFAGALICAWIVAFFPILSSTTVGLKSTDHNLRDLFGIYGANRWQRLRHLQAPAALPYFLSGLRIGGGLALIGSVVAEFVIGRSGTGLGLASVLLEAGYRLNIPRLFAALLLISALGVLIFMVLSLISHLLLRKWHESAVRREA